MEMNEAIEVIKRNYPHVTESGSQFETALRLLIPELKESEDERIRKALINFLHEGNPFKNIKKETRQRWIAWLEKQGEHAKFRDSIQVGDKVTRNRDGMLVNLSQLKRVAKPAEKYNITGIGSKNAQGKLGEMIKNLKPADKVEPKFCIGDVVKRGLSTLIISSINFKKRFYELSTKEGIVVSCVPFSEQDNWELVAKNTTIRPKYCVMSNSPYCPYYNKHQHAWSEEDEKVLSDIIKDLVHPWNEYIPDRIEDEIKWLKNKLKSLKDRCTWNPSDEQMKQLGWIAEQNKDNMIGKELMSLYQDLLKLKE